MFMPKVLQLYLGQNSYLLVTKKKPWAVYHVSVTANKTDIIIVSF